MVEAKNGVFVQTVADLSAQDRDFDAIALYSAIEKLKSEVKAHLELHPELDICVARENAADYPEDSKEFWSCICYEFLNRLESPQDYA